VYHQTQPAAHLIHRYGKRLTGDTTAAFMAFRAGGNGSHLPPRDVTTYLPSLPLTFENLTSLD